MKIDGFEKVIDIYDISIEMKVGQHSVCTFYADIKEEDIINYIKMPENHFQTRIVARKSGIELMKGFVQKVSVINNFSGASVFVSVISDSYRCSEKVNKKIFQNKTKSCKKIIEHYKDYNISFQNADEADETIENIIFQNDISDFDFIKYVASLCGCGVWVDNSSLIIGKSLNCNCTQNVKSDVFSEKIIKAETEYLDDNIHLTFETMNYIKNGSIVSFENMGKLGYLGSKTFVIYEVYMYKQEDDVYYRYKAMEKLKFNSAYNPSFAVSRGKVVRNDDPENQGNICVNFLDYDDVDFDKNNSVWIKYTSPYTGNQKAGIVMIPDEDDIVHTHIYPDYYISYGSIRENVIPEKCSDIKNKSIMIGEKRLIQFNDSDIVIENSEKNRTVINEEKININIKDKTDVIIEDKKITIKIGEKTSTIIEDNKLSVKTGEKTTIESDNNKISIIQNESGIVLEKEGITSEKKGKSQITLNDNIEIKSEAEISVFSKKESELKTTSGYVDVNGSNITLKGTSIKMST